MPSPPASVETIKREPRPEDALDYVCEVIHDEPGQSWPAKVLEKIKEKLGLVGMEKGESDETLS